MPGNGVEDRTWNLYELNNLSQGQHLSQAVGNHWQLINYNQLAGKSVNNRALPNFNFDSYVSEPLGSGIIQANFIDGQLDPYYSRNSNSFSVANQPGYFGESDCFNQQHLTSKGFHIPKPLQDNYCADSPTLTTNSERSEITEASCDFNFLGGNQNTLMNQSLDSPNYCEMQQSGFNEMQLVQQNFMYRQLQEQRQQQLHQFSDNRQQHSFNQLANGMSVSDSPQMLGSRMQLMEPNGAQALLCRSMFPPEQSVSASQMNSAPQQLDMSLYGTPVSDLRFSMPQFPYLQGMSYDSTNLLTKAGGQAQKGSILFSEFGNLYTADQSSELGVSPESFLAKQGITVKGGDNQFHFQGLGSGMFTQNVQGNPPRDHDTFQPGISGREDQAERQTVQHTTKQAKLPQDLVPLDPLEAKILYNTDENIWDAFGDDGPGMISGGFDNTSEHRASSNAFTSIQNGGWSALMQSAVAEASSSDTGMHEEFSGLTFQNTENSNENQKTSWVDNPSQNASHSPKSYDMVGDTSTSFPGFHQPGNRSSIELRNDLNRDSSPRFFDNFNSQKTQSVEGSQKTRMFLHSGNTWPGQMTSHLQTNEQNQRVAPSTFLQADKVHESMGKIQREINDSCYDPNETVNESYQKLNYYQRDDSITKGPSGHEQGHLEHFKFFGSNSSDTDVDKSPLPVIQAYGRTPKEVYAGHQFSVGNQSRSMLTEVPGANHGMAFGSQLYMQAAASQGQGLNLAPPLQKPTNANSSLSPPSIMDGSNSTKANPELEKRNKMCSTPSSFPSEPHESSPEATWENTTSSAGNSGTSYWRAVTPHANTRNDAQIHAMSHMPVASQSNSVMSPGGGGRHETSSKVSSHDTFPVLETSTVHHTFNTSGVSHQHDITRNSHNQWASVPVQQQSCYAKPFRPSPQFPSWAEPPNSTMRTAMSVSQGPVAHNSIKGEGESSEFPVPSSQGSGYGEHLEGVSQKQIPSVLPDGSQIDETTQNQDSGATFTFQTLASQSPFKGLHGSPGQGMSINKDTSPSIFEVQHAPVLEGLQFADNNSWSRSVDSATNSASLPNCLVAEETKMTIFNEDNRSGLTSSQDCLQATPSQEMVMFGHSTPNAQPSAVNSPSSGDHSPANLSMSPRIKQYETLSNGQMVPLLNTRLAKAAFQQLSPGQPSQIPYTSLERLDTGLSACGWPSPSTTIVASYEPKKRKAAMSGLLPWHKEVTQESKRIRSLSMAEKLWSRATNRLAEKVEDEIEEMQPVHRSKSRITLTSQLMQLLFLPAPSSIFSSEPTASTCETLIYLASRLSLGDSCRISCSKENVLLGPASGSVTNVEEYSSVGRSSNLQRGESSEVLVSRIKSLENDIQRLDKTASVVDLRTELQELEKFSVINRFAKFHARGPPEGMGTSSMNGPPRLFLQRYVTAFPLLSNLPEGVQCFSL